MVICALVCFLWDERMDYVYSTWIVGVGTCSMWFYYDVMIAWLFIGYTFSGSFDSDVLAA